MKICLAEMNRDRVVTTWDVLPYRKILLSCIFYKLFTISGLVHGIETEKCWQKQHFRVQVNFPGHRFAVIDAIFTANFSSVPLVIDINSFI